jgi:hypothetical protein
MSFARLIEQNNIDVQRDRRLERGRQYLVTLGIWATAFALTGCGFLFLEWLAR